MSAHIHRFDCTCIRNFSRRSLLGPGLGILASSAVSPARVADEDYEAMLVKRIDPRFTTTNTGSDMSGRGWQSLCSQFNDLNGTIEPSVEAARF